MQIACDMAETVLQSRLEGNSAYADHLHDVLKEVRNMIFSPVYQRGIIHKLIKKESYQVRNKVMKQIETYSTLLPRVGIRIECR